VPTDSEKVGRAHATVKTYRVNEIFYSLQGEGVRAGTAALFLRFSGCNLQCRVDTHGFDCDTEFVSGRSLTLEQIIAELREAERRKGDRFVLCEAPAGPFRQNEPVPYSPPHRCEWVILTGGEPALQVDRELIDALHAAGFKLAIETNGSIELPDGLDWITVSPKVAEHAIRQRTANEVKYVRAYGQPIPKTGVKAEHRLISPAFSGDMLEPRTLAWCIQLVKDNPDWRLSVQQHKYWGIR